MAAATVTEAFIDRLLAIDYRSLPREAIEMSRQVTLDGLARHARGRGRAARCRANFDQLRARNGRRAAGVGDRRRLQDFDAERRVCERRMAHALDFENIAVSAQPSHVADAARDPRDRGALPRSREENHRGDRRRVRSAGAGAASRRAISRRAEAFTSPAPSAMFGAVAAATKMLDLDTAGRR